MIQMKLYIFETINWTVPKYGTVQVVGYIEEGAPLKVTGSQSGSRNCQPMILATGAYLRDYTVQCSTVVVVVIVSVQQ